MSRLGELGGGCRLCWGGGGWVWLLLVDLLRERERDLLVEGGYPLPLYLNAHPPQTPYSRGPFLMRSLYCKSRYRR